MEYYNMFVYTEKFSLEIFWKWVALQKKWVQSV